MRGSTCACPTASGATQPLCWREPPDLSPSQPRLQQRPAGEPGKPTSGQTAGRSRRMQLSPSSPQVTNPCGSPARLGQDRHRKKKKKKKGQGVFFFFWFYRIRSAQVAVSKVARSLATLNLDRTNLRDCFWAPRHTPYAEASRSTPSHRNILRSYVYVATPWQYT